LIQNDFENKLNARKNMPNATLKTLEKYEEIGILEGLSIINIINPRCDSPLYQLFYSLENKQVGFVCTNRSDEPKQYKGLEAAFNDSNKIIGNAPVLTLRQHDDPVNEYLHAKYIEPYYEFNLEQQTPYMTIEDFKELK